jgi:hypothetical protein
VRSGRGFVSGIALLAGNGKGIAAFRLSGLHALWLHLLSPALDGKISPFTVTGVTDAATEPAHEEGPSTAAYDFNDARFRIHQVRGEIHQAEVSRRRGQLVLILGTPVLLAVLLALNLARFFDGSPLRINLVMLVAGDVITGVALIAVLAYNIGGIGQSRRQIAESRLQLAKLREAERDARTRLISGGLTRLLWTYHSDVVTTIEEYRDHALKYRKIHNRFQTIIIVGSLATTAITTAAATSYSLLEIVAACFSFAVGISAGMTGYFKFRERSMNLQQAADELDLEYKGAELGIHAYRTLANEEDRLLTFAERAESIKNEQRKREQQLEQPPESASASANNASNAAP